VLNLYLDTDSISLTRSSNADVDVVASFIDRDQTTGDVGAADREAHTFNSAATTDIVAPPTSGDTRNVKAIFIRNRHASTSNTVTVQLDAAGTLYQLHSEVLAAGECLTYLDGIGFCKTTLPELSVRSFVKTSDQTFAQVNTFEDVTELSCSVSAGLIYAFSAYIIHKSVNATDGARFAMNLTSAATIFSAMAISSVSRTSVNAGVWASSAPQTTLNTAIVAQTAASNGNDVWSIVTGTVQPSANDTLVVRATGEENPGPMTIRAGSLLRVWRDARLDS
jgi:hypothetical protein